MTQLPRPVAVVSGASSGIGAAVARLLLEKGYSVVGLSRRGNQKLAEDSRYTDCIADLTDATALNLALDADPTIAEHGVKAVVLNAGYSPEPTDLRGLTWRSVADTYSTNVATALNVVQSTCEPLRQAGGGSFTFVGASLANGYCPDRVAYAASKAALTTLMRAASVEFADDDIVSNEVRPGPVATAMTMPGLADDVNDDILHVISEGFRTDWLKSARTVAEWIVTIAEFPPRGPTGQIFNYSRKVL